MPLLLYCVAPESLGETRARGVGGASVGSRVHGGLRYFVSDNCAENVQDLAVAAREVHGVIQDVFARGPVLPFRYPTIVKDELELSRLATERGAAFAEFLQWVGERVQMDIRITGTSAQAVRTDATSGVDPLGVTTVTGAASPLERSGRAYLAGKAARGAALHESAKLCRELSRASEWRMEEREASVLCRALIDRHEVISFQESMRRLALPDGVQAVVSGPWPPAGFWEDKFH